MTPHILEKGQLWVSTVHFSLVVLIVEYHQPESPSSWSGLGMRILSNDQNSCAFKIGSVQRITSESGFLNASCKWIKLGQ